MNYDDLTPDQRIVLRKRQIINGCGPQNWRGPKPNFFFKACCDVHDWNYAVGGDESDRRWSDWGFYQAMIKDTKRLVWWQQILARAQAWLFYRLVRWRGKNHFYYGQKRTFQEVLDA